MRTKNEHIFGTHRDPVVAHECAMSRVPSSLVHVLSGYTLSKMQVRGSVGRFIGPRGQNIRALQDRTDTIIYGHGEKNGNEFVVYYKSDMALKKVLRAAGEV